MTMDKTMLIAVLAGAAIAGTYASCANSCSGHGTCGAHDRCTCFPMYEGTDCSLKSCPSGPAFVDGANADDVHAYAVCSGRGTCSFETGECNCADGFTGYNCGRTVCPNDCSGHGTCAFASDISTAGYTAYDAKMTRSCVCDGYYSGADCSFRQCPRGDDPLTTEIECQGVSSGTQSHEVQEITITADTMLSGEMTLTYTDAYGQSWTTTPIVVGGDNKFDVRLGADDTEQCGLFYQDGLDSASLQYGTVRDFGATDYSHPSNAADGLVNVACNAATAAQMDAMISHNPVVSNVQVTKSTDVTDGAKFEVTVGNFNFQNKHTAGEIGKIGLKNAAVDVIGETVHPLGDHSEDIARALTSLPYNVIPSVTVSKQTVMSSDYTSADVTMGSGIQQKYRVTFSDAANAGDQNTLQCNAEGCDEDGCAPRYSGVNHEKFISTKYYEPQAEGSSTTDYRTAIVATGQGGFWLRHYKAARESITTFTSGTYYIHRDLGNGKTSSATFQYNDDAAAIQSALQTIEGWGGISVSCNSGAGSYGEGKGTPGKAGEDWASTSGAHGLQCYVTYAVGYDDGARLPTMTYNNFNGAEDATLTGAPHSMVCKSEVCTMVLTDMDTATKNFNIGWVDGNTQPRYENNNGFFYFEHEAPHTQDCTISNTAQVIGQTVVGQTSGCVGYIGKAGTATAAKIVITNGIDCAAGGEVIKVNGVSITASACAAATHAKVTTGTYEIIRTASNSQVQQLMFFSPGQADCDSYVDCVDPSSVTESGTFFGDVYETTPLMPMWPSVSNSIALHDTTMRVIIDADRFIPTGGSATLPEAWTSAIGSFNIGYGSLGLSYDADLTDATGGGATTRNVASTCADIQSDLLKYSPTGTAGYSTTGTPFPSLAHPTDSTRSICDCHKMDGREVRPYVVMFDITCPGWLGNLLSLGATVRSIAKVGSSPDNTASFIHTSFVYMRQTPPSGLTTKVAVGDKLTILASNSNNNKQYTVKAFVDDGMWGSGRANIWSTAAGFLGKESATAADGFANHVSAGVVLDSAMNYRSYGDFVQYAKVEPSPVGTDYGITEMKAVGQNSTLFTRTLESISTRATSTASLTFYDTGATANTNDFELINVQAISGTFQLIYDGEETAVMQASASAADMQDAIAGISTIDIAPTVTKTFSTGATASAQVPGPHSNAAATHSNSVTWTIEFSAKSGDAKKLTFKYTDTIGTERQASNVLSSTGVALTNTVGSTTASANVYTEFAINNIVMQYLHEGSTFFDALLTSSAAGTAAAAAASVHDELAADVTVGSTFDVKSSEQFMMFFFDELTGTPVDVDAKMCATAVAAAIVFEYDGEFSAPTDICATTANFESDSNLAAALNTLSGVANGLVNVEGKGVTGTTDAGSSYGAASVNRDTGTAVKDTFNKHFPWGATATGSAHGMIKVTLPLGLDGSKFRMHLQTFNGKQLGLGSTSLAGQVYVHRARNNNGRTFEVTQAYENKVAGMTHFSKSNAAVDPATGTYVPASDTLGSAMGSLTINAFPGDATKFNPGTYYNVKLGKDAGAAVTGVGSGIFAKVVVSIGAVTHVEITAGGIQVKKGEVYTISCDTRIHSDFTDCDGTAADGTRQDVALKDSTSTADVQNIVLPGIRVGAVSTAIVSTDKTALCGIGEIGRRFSESGAAAATGGMLVNIQTRWRCSGLAGVATTLDNVIALSPGAPNGAGTFSKKAELEANAGCVVALKNVGATNGKTAQADTTAKFELADLNTFYYQAGFYDTVTPQFNQDALHANSLNGADVQESDMMAVMGGRQQDGGYLYTSYVGGDDQQLFGGLKDVASRGNGNGRRTALTALTSSLLVGSQGKAKTGDDLVTLHNTFSEHMDKYAYVGRGFDRLTVTPQPDEMDSMKLEVTYHGAAGACSVTEVDRGTHESSVCSGRGNCDFSTGTCLCDAGYTLEACSEQTVLV